MYNDQNNITVIARKPEQFESYIYSLYLYMYYQIKMISRNTYIIFVYRYLITKDRLVLIASPSVRLLLIASPSFRLVPISSSSFTIVPIASSSFRLLPVESPSFRLNYC